MPDGVDRRTGSVRHAAKRLIGHIAVVAIVLFAVVAGMGDAQPREPRRSPVAGPLQLISAARGATAEEATPEVSAIDLKPHPLDISPPMSRGGVSERGFASRPEPLPTPVPVDPNATPLPAPLAIGETSDSVGGGGTAASATATLIWPVANGGSISQYFSAGHLALDIPAAAGTQVSVAAGGIVTSAGWRNNGGGLVVEIDHGNGMTTVYNHLGSIWITAGQQVAAGQAIAGIGCTGVCTGPHTHFEVIVRGQRQNPLRFF